MTMTMAIVARLHVTRRTRSSIVFLLLVLLHDPRINFTIPLSSSYSRSSGRDSVADGKRQRDKVEEAVKSTVADANAVKESDLRHEKHTHTHTQA